MGKVVAAGIFLVNKNNNVLICHPTNHPMDFWSIPKGKIEDGESLLECALRETFEETNIDLRKCGNIIKLDPVSYRHGKKILHPFLIWEPLNQEVDWYGFDIRCLTHVPEDRGGFPEMDQYKWVDFNEAKKLLHYVQAECIEPIINLIQNV
jgi:8-oxo-dGTP pyrophosphatase MutT (NUDIX family)